MSDISDTLDDRMTTAEGLLSDLTDMLANKADRTTTSDELVAMEATLNELIADVNTLQQRLRVLQDRLQNFQISSS